MQDLLPNGIKRPLGYGVMGLGFRVFDDSIFFVAEGL